MESEKASFNLSTLHTKIMAYGPINSWQIEGGKVESVTDFIYLGSKITTDGDCRQKMLAPWKKSYDKPRQCIEKQRHYFVSKGPCSQAMVFTNSHEQI